MLRQLQGSFRGRFVSRAGALAAVGVLAFALGACSVFHRMRPGSETGAEIKNPPGSDQPYPNLGEVPDRPKQTETADSRREIARSLVADREAARYTDQALRGGTEASAPPPPPPIAGVMPVAPPEDGTGATDDGMKMADNKAGTKKPGFFARLFGAKEETAPAAGPAPLPAQPTGNVDVQQAPPAN